MYIYPVALFGDKIIVLDGQVGKQVQKYEKNLSNHKAYGC